LIEYRTWYLEDREGTTGTSSFFNLPELRSVTLHHAQGRTDHDISQDKVHLMPIAGLGSQIWFMTLGIAMLVNITARSTFFANVDPLNFLASRSTRYMLGAARSSRQQDAGQLGFTTSQDQL
jgi:hypothetical protein